MNFRREVPRSALLWGDSLLSVCPNYVTMSASKVLEIDSDYNYSVIPNLFIDPL